MIQTPAAMALCWDVLSKRLRVDQAPCSRPLAHTELQRLQAELLQGTWWCAVFPGPHSRPTDWSTGQLASNTELSFSRWFNISKIVRGGKQLHGRQEEQLACLEGCLGRKLPETRFCPKKESSHLGSSLSQLFAMVTREGEPGRCGVLLWERAPTTWGHPDLAGEWPWPGPGLKNTRWPRRLPSFMLSQRASCSMAACRKSCCIQTEKWNLPGQHRQVTKRMKGTPVSSLLNLLSSIAPKADRRFSWAFLSRQATSALQTRGTTPDATSLHTSWLEVGSVN